MIALPSFRPAFFGDSPLFGPLLSFCAVGDSITDRMSLRNSDYDYVAMSTDGWGAALEALSMQRIRSVARGVTGISGSPPPSNDRDHGYSGINAAQYRLGAAAGPGAEWLNAVVPVTLAKATNPDVFIVHIGTNDIGESAATIAARVQALWADLATTGKPVIGTDILQRGATYSGWNATLRDKVNAVNAILRTTWRANGCVAYRQWDDLIDKDVNGYAVATEFPNDQLHPTQRVGHKLGKDLLGFLSEFIAGTSPTIPAAGSGLWVTPNSQVSGNQGDGRATSWAGIGITIGSNATPSKVTDGDGTVWQRLTLSAAIGFSQAGLYSRITSGIPASGTRVRATARVRLPSPSALSSISLQCQQVGAPQASDWHDLFGRGGGTTIASPLIHGDEYLLYSEPFTVQSSVTQLWCAVCFTSSAVGAVYDFREAGIYLDPA